MLAHQVHRATQLALCQSVNCVHFSIKCPDRSLRVRWDRRVQPSFTVVNRDVHVGICNLSWQDSGRAFDLSLLGLACSHLSPHGVGRDEPVDTCIVLAADGKPQHTFVVSWEIGGSFWQLAGSLSLAVHTVQFPRTARPPFIHPVAYHMSTAAMRRLVVLGPNADNVVRAADTLAGMVAQTFVVHTAPLDALAVNVVTTPGRVMDVGTMRNTTCVVVACTCGALGTAAQARLLCLGWWCLWLAPDEGMRLIHPEKVLDVSRLCDIAFLLAREGGASAGPCE